MGYAVAMGMETSSRYTQDSYEYLYCMYHERCTPSQAHFSSPNVLLLIVKFIPTISGRDPTLNSESSNTIGDVF